MVCRSGLAWRRELVERSISDRTTVPELKGMLTESGGVPTLFIATAALDGEPREGKMARDPSKVVQDRMDPALGVFTEPQYEIGSG